MKGMSALIALTVLSGWAGPVPRDAREDVQRALEKLEASGNFSWVSTTSEETDGDLPQFSAEMQGRSVKGGWSQISKSSSKKGSEAFLKDDRIAVMTADGWKVVDAKVEPPAGGKLDKAVKQAQQFVLSRAPVTEAKGLLNRLEDMKSHGGGTYSGRVAALDVPIYLERAKAAGKGAPSMEEPRIRVNFRVRDGVLAAYELVVTGRHVKKKSGQAQEIVFSAAVDILDVGTTTLEIPEEARKVLE